MFDIGWIFGFEQLKKMISFQARNDQTVQGFYFQLKYLLTFRKHFTMKVELFVEHYQTDRHKLDSLCQLQTF